MPAGRPLKFKTKEELQQRIDDYFKKCDSRTIVVLDRKGNEHSIVQPRPYTITGLAYELDTDRETLLRYEEKEEFSDTIKKAKDKIHNFTEEKLYQSGIAAGVIFNLTNNWGWKNQKYDEVNLTNNEYVLIKNDKDKNIQSSPVSADNRTEQGKV